MTGISPTDSRKPATPWSLAVMLLARWLENNERADALLESLPPALPGVERGRCQSLLFGAIRHLGRIDAHLSALVERAPRPRLKAALLVAGFELIEGGDEHHAARVVHHAVEQTKTLASAPEARLVNAVVRRLAAALAADRAPPALATAERLAAWFSHPEWLVRRWLAQFAAAGTRAFLEWNQQPAPVLARWRLRARAPSDAELAWLAPARWPGFFEVRPGRRAEMGAAIADGRIYVQDASTRLAVELLAPRPGERILDACAAPGGKSVLIADTLAAAKEAGDGGVGDGGGGGVVGGVGDGVVGVGGGVGGGGGGGGGGGAPARLVALDLPGPRIDRLRENLARAPAGVEVALVQAELAKAGRRLFADHNLPGEYDAVLLDAPCSNTGVMRHRVDVKWRLRPGDIEKHAGRQLALLDAAARRVAPGGRLVYSTCSVDEVENERVVEAFLERAGARFELGKSVVAHPWLAGHDGAAVFLLRRK
ncbi:MAG: RNA methyltransferase [Opitutaceae bacterium]|jgi:16S rRNA (cytosine967-C5)-methyltransferase|nr:RNA methyltransferase [Opitutaceae bacterium]